MNTAAGMELILSRGRMDTTYKLAVLRAIVDFVIDHPAREPRNGLHRIPVIELARRVLAYYWRPVLARVPQGQSDDANQDKGRPIIVVEVSKLQARCDLTVLGQNLQSHEAGLPLTDWITGAEALPDAITAALVAIRTVLVKQPFQYISKVGDRRLDVFSLVTAGVDPAADFENHRSAAGRGNPFAGASTWVQLLDAEPANVVLSARAYEEISEVRFWLHDSIVLRWALQCAAWRGEGPPVGVDVFDLSCPAAREPQTVHKLRQLYEALGFTTCMYSTKPLSSSWDLDHVLPFSRFPVSYFWNLVPADHQLNNEKRDRLPPLSSDLLARYDDFVHRCVSSGDDLVRAHVRASFREHFQQDDVPSTAGAAEGIQQLFRSCYFRLEQAGVDVWKPESFGLS